MNPLIDRQQAKSFTTGIGQWQGDRGSLCYDEQCSRQMVHDLRKPVYVLQDASEQIALSHEGHASLGDFGEVDQQAVTLRGFAPATSLEQLGDKSFCHDHRLKYAYMTGAMANGIASSEMVEAIARIGGLGSFGAAGLSLERVEQVIDQLQENLTSEQGVLPYCINLIHSPNEPEHEAALVELFIRRQVTLVEASAYLGLTLPAVRYRVHGIYRDEIGRVVTPNQIIAKASRVEVATYWFSPPPEKMLRELVAKGNLTAEQAEMAKTVPMAQDVTAEADSGGHTDNRPAVSMIPTFLDLRDTLADQFGYDRPLRVGAGGGVATPASAAAMFAMGAAYLVTGSVNQACVESGSCDHVRKLLAQTKQADVIMAPAADMFEMGVKLQVLKRGTMFAMRAQKLYDLYRAYDAIEQIPDHERLQIEKTIFRATLDDVWTLTSDFFAKREPNQVTRAKADSKHKMALIFRWYLGLSSRWANAGEMSRQMDFQIWAGPAMGAFNQWTQGSDLAQPENRKVADVALNLLYGAAVIARLNSLKQQGVALASSWTKIQPQTLDQLEGLLD